MRKCNPERKQERSNDTSLYGLKSPLLPLYINAMEVVEEEMKSSRRTIRAYRREKSRQKKKRACKLVKTCAYKFPNCNFVKERGENEYFVPKKNSHISTFYKRQSGKIVRRNNTGPNSTRSHYRKEYDYWWTVD